LGPLRRVIHQTGKHLVAQETQRTVDAVGLNH